MKALSYCHALPSAPKILDVGCGTGSQTLIFADDEDAQAIADRTEQEMKIITANFEYCGYEYYILQKTIKLSRNAALAGPP